MERSCQAGRFRIFGTKDFYCEQILSGRIAVECVAEPATAMAFHPSHRPWPVHLVILPKRHMASLATTETHGGCRFSTNRGDRPSTRHLHFYLHSGKRIRHEDGSPVTQEC